MMKPLVTLLALAALLLAGCNDKKAAEAPPPPHSLTAEAIGAFCGMNVLEHPGPKAQIILSSALPPVWFSTVRDAFAYTMLPEEPVDIRAIYVSDMGKAPSWDLPGADNWVEAHEALFVIGGSQIGGLGFDEAVPFSERAAAESFVAAHGGRIVGFADVPRDYVLGSGANAGAAGAVAEMPPAGDTGAHAN